VIVYVARVERTVDVPLISPVDVSRIRPFGSAGAIDHVTTVPPVVVAVTGVIAIPFVSTIASSL
jgi:hypothetical protein